ncbi:hypothetical protein Dimus_017082 [Dionaea muscipula]
MILREYSILVLQLATLIASAIAANVSSSSNSPIICNRWCGSGKSAKRVEYPFGFSSGCGIQLNCSENRVQLSGFDVLNLTSENLVLNFTAKCSRSIDTIKKLFGNSYAPTSRNGLLLQNCSSASSECVVPVSLLESRFPLQDCNSNNLTCYAWSGVEGFLTLKNLSSIPCRFVFSSIFVNSSNSSPDVSLEFETVQLGWWLPGNSCRCSENASFQNLSTPYGNYGCLCRCSDGFTGDGFASGDGCRRIGCEGHCGRTINRTAIVIAGILAGAAVAVVLAILCCLRRCSTSSKSHTSAKRLLYEAAGSSNIPLYPYKEIERATNGFSEKQQLGTGAYGTVFAGILHNDMCVAIKKIKHRDDESIEQVMNEIKLLSSVSHPNLVRLLGCCVENGEQILVYEYMHNGTLAQHLQRERGNGLPWTVRLTIAAETAKAIAYLHTAMNPPIYHRDIKSSNILLDTNYQSKVADFGLSRVGMMETSHISTAPQGTPGYVDPEYHQNFYLSDKSDVYSFGVVLVEIITALKVVDFTRPQSEVNLAALAIDRIGKGRVDEIIDPFLDPNRDAWTLTSIHKVAELAFRCLAYHRDMRPSMTEVADELEQVRLSGWAPLEVNICMGSSVASSYSSSPFNGSERSLNNVDTIKKGVASRRGIVPQKLVECYLGSMEEVKDSSPVSVRDPWLSEQSSPSANSLLATRALQ